LHDGTPEAVVQKVGLTAVALLALAVVGHAQDPVPQLPRVDGAGRHVFRSTASMVALNVTVTDGGKLVRGLQPQDFEVYEDGVRQQVRFFESADVPMDVILLLDASSSMRDRMPVVHDAARSFMKMLRPGDRGAVVAFAGKVRVAQDLTGDPAAIERAINGTVANGSTVLNDAVYIALKQFGRPARDTGDVRRQAIAVLSDGQDTSSLTAFDDVVALARKTGVSIYTINLQSPSEAVRELNIERSPDATYSLRMLARETGARAFTPSNVNELKHVYDSISEELEAQYSLAYTPTDSRADGRFRRIVVRVLSSPSCRPRTRTGYTADTVVAEDFDVLR
jgi:Ca-activated chloride channel family protein